MAEFANRVRIEADDTVSTLSESVDIMFELANRDRWAADDTESESIGGY